MERIKCLIGVYTCNRCKVTHPFSERLPNEKVRRFSCPHFTLILNMVRIEGKIKFQMRTLCNICYKEYNSELKIGCTNFNNNLILEDSYNSLCCGNRLEAVVSLCEEYIEQNEPSDIYDSHQMNNYNNMNNNINANMNNNNNFNQFNPMGINNMNNMQFNMNNQNMNNMNQMIINNNNFQNNFNSNNNNFNNNINNNIRPNNNFSSSNVIQIGQKNKLVNFFDESSSQNYKIYTSPHLPLKNVLNDLLELYPEINYFNNNLILNQIILSPNSTIESLNLNENSVIVIKNM